MRILLSVLWLLIPIGALAYHLGPGQDNLKRDEAARQLAQADAAAAQQDWSEAIKGYNQALAVLPSSDIDRQRRIRLERAKCQMLNHQLPEANEDLKALADELRNESPDSEMLTECEIALANSEYYLTWLKRLEGLPRESWEPDVTASEQLYRRLAEEAEQEGRSSELLERKKDLESAVKLARLDLGDLQGLPLPNQ